MVPEWVKTIVTVVLSGGFLSFLQYMINRHDTRHDQIKALEKKLEDGLKERDETGKGRYDEHKDAIEELRQAIIAMAEDSKETKRILTESIKENRDITANVAELVVGLGQDKLIHLTDKYQRRGAITNKEKASLKAIYVPYHDKLGGNGYGKMGYEYCMDQLPVVTEEEALDMDRKRERG